MAKKYNSPNDIGNIALELSAVEMQIETTTARLRVLGLDKKMIKQIESAARLKVRLWGGDRALWFSCCADVVQGIVTAGGELTREIIECW